MIPPGVSDVETPQLLQWRTLRAFLEKYQAGEDPLECLDALYLRAIGLQPDLDRDVMVREVRDEFGVPDE